MRVAHLSDLHLLSAAARSRSLSARFVSLGRPLDVEGRRAKATRALRLAHEGGAEHVIVSGDMTELGAPEEFELLAEVLASSPFASEQISMVPGNHDIYSAADGFQRALQGPLAAYRAQSVWAPGQVPAVDLGELVLLLVDTTRFQSVISSYGVFDPETSRALGDQLQAARGSKVPRVVVQHHPPFRHRSSAYQLIDGLKGWRGAHQLLLEHPELTLLHGHLHSSVTRAVGTGAPRVFAPEATVDGRGDFVRFYEVEDGALRPC